MVVDGGAVIVVAVVVVVVGVKALYSTDHPS